jgi:hypothetical protein
MRIFQAGASSTARGLLRSRTPGSARIEISAAACRTASLLDAPGGVVTITD